MINNFNEKRLLQQRAFCKIKRMGGVSIISGTSKRSVSGTISDLIRTHIISILLLHCYYTMAIYKCQVAAEKNISNDYLYIFNLPLWSLLCSLDSCILNRVDTYKEFVEVSTLIPN